MHDTVLDRYTWLGTTGDAPKFAFKNLININNLTFWSVCHQFPYYTRHEYDKYLVEWLKHSTTRQRTVINQYPQREDMNDEDGDQNDDEDGGQNDDQYGNEYGNDENNGDEQFFDDEADFFDE